MDDDLDAMVFVTLGTEADTFRYGSNPPKLNDNCLVKTEKINPDTGKAEMVNS